MCCWVSWYSVLRLFLTHALAMLIVVMRVRLRLILKSKNWTVYCKWVCANLVVDYAHTPRCWSFQGYVHLQWQIWFRTIGLRQPSSCTASAPLLFIFQYSSYTVVTYFSLRRTSFSCFRHLWSPAKWVKSQIIQTHSVNFYHVSLCIALYMLYTLRQFVLSVRLSICMSAVQCFNAINHIGVSSLQYVKNATCCKTTNENNVETAV